MVMDFGGESQTIQVGSDNSYNGGLNVSLLYLLRRFTRVSI